MPYSIVYDMNKTQQTPKHQGTDAVSPTISRLSVYGEGSKTNKGVNKMNNISIKDRELIEELCLKRFDIKKGSFDEYYIETWCERFSNYGSDFVSYMDNKTLAIWKDIYNNFLTKKGA